MYALNKVMLIGNLGQDPEQRQLPSGGSVVTFSVATTESWTSKDGNRNDRTEWHRVVIFNDKICKVASNYLRRGSKVYVEGKLRTRKWAASDGTEKQTTEIVVDGFGCQIIILDQKGSGPCGDGQHHKHTPAKQLTQTKTLSQDLDDEIPF